MHIKMMPIKDYEYAEKHGVLSYELKNYLINGEDNDACEMIKKIESYVACIIEKFMNGKSYFTDMNSFINRTNGIFLSMTNIHSIFVPIKQELHSVSNGMRLSLQSIAQLCMSTEQ